VVSQARANGDVHALTVQQPWAYAITVGAKTVENRTWTTRYRGPLLIHAGKTVDVAAFGLRLIRELAQAQALAADLSPTMTTARFERLLTPAGHVRGGFVAATTLTDVHQDTGTCCGPWAARSHPAHLPIYHWTLADTRPIDPPLGAAGRQGLWAVHFGSLILSSIGAKTDTVPVTGDVL
jgi:hypothetical protein